MPHRPANPARLRPFRCKCGGMVDVSGANEAARVLDVLDMAGYGYTVLAPLRCGCGEMHTAVLKKEARRVQI